MFAKYRAPDDPRRKELDKRIALAWLALRNAERNGNWVRAGELAYGTIPRLERELDQAAVRVVRAVQPVYAKPTSIPEVTRATPPEKTTGALNVVPALLWKA
jgi:hypothetical protein